MLKYFSKIAMDILPSVAATIIGAYIVNHYIVAKPAADAPATAAVSPANPKKVTPKADSKPAGTSSDVSNLPEAGVRAKGISEKAISEKAAAEKAASEKIASEMKGLPPKGLPPKGLPPKGLPLKRLPWRNPHPTSPRRSPPTSRRRPPASPPIRAGIRRDRAKRRPPSLFRRRRWCLLVTPEVAAPNTAPPVEAAVAPEDRLNANDIARAALERLRGSSEGATHTLEAARSPDARPRLASNPPCAAPAVRPLPPPIMVSTPGNDKFESAPGSSRNPPYAAAAPGDDPRRPTPPADIPAAPPLDLRAEAAEPPPAPAHTNVAEDMLAAMKSVFHAVLPKPSQD